MLKPYWKQIKLRKHGWYCYSLTLDKLKKLYLTANNLTKIPLEIGQLKNLTELDLSFNNLVYLPHKESGRAAHLFRLGHGGNGRMAGKESHIV